MSNTSNVMAMMEKYSTEKAPKATGDKNPNRVTVGQVFIQPTGKTKENYKYCYYGIKAQDGSFISGFSMSNEKMLGAVLAGMLPEAFADAFKVFADKFGAEHQVM